MQIIETLKGVFMARRSRKPVKVVKVEVVKEAQEPVEDRSAYNCSACSGLGLEDERHICGRCLGTGKI